MAPLSGDGPRFELTDEGSYLRLRWHAGIVMELEDVEASVSAVIAMSPECKRPLLVHIDLVDGISAPARDLLLEETCSSRTAVLGSDEVARVMTAFNYRAATPSRYFTDETAAVQWLISGHAAPDGGAAPDEAQDPDDGTNPDRGSRPARAEQGPQAV
ncbi:STAS/SEC14 domain-containing protein [Arthrobacter sp. 35/47]|uniref:STAS/SEC14 domain-containing protein n=1 Tax=Arthrobacter sp. 35/47 TaxID=269454 RepID=UPI00047B6512|nr:STAS/SEC14 domain-containing protein [Arthrobacter sp. 35/47]